MRMGKERAELQERTAKGGRFDATTDEGITFRSLLAKASEGSENAKDFLARARQENMGLEVWRVFNKHIIGNHTPLQYDTQFAGAIAKLISDSLSAGQKVLLSGTYAATLQQCPEHQRTMVISMTSYILAIVTCLTQADSWQ